MTDQMTKRGWYCVRSLPKSEHIAAGHLAVLEDVEAYCPRLRFKKMTRRGPVWFSEALFPGYLFARFVPMTSQKEVTYARGVSGIIRFGGQLSVIPDTTISDLRSHMGEQECKTIDADVREGDAVTITSGTFRGLTTVVTQLLPAGERVRVLMEFLGQCREVEVSRSQLLAQPRHVLSV